MAVGVSPATGDSSSHLSSCSRCWAASRRPTRPKNGSLAMSSSSSRPSAAQQLLGALAPADAPLHDGVGVGDADDLSHVEDLHTRGVVGGLAPEDVGVAGVERQAALGERAACRHRRVQRVAGRRRGAPSRSSSESRPVLAARGELVLKRQPASRLHRRRTRSRPGAGTRRGSRWSRAARAGPRGGSTAARVTRGRRSPGRRGHRTSDARARRSFRAHRARGRRCGRAVPPPSARRGRPPARDCRRGTRALALTPPWRSGADRHWSGRCARSRSSAAPTERRADDGRR